MMMAYNILSIVFVIAFLVIDFFVAGEFYKAAVMKGWPQKKYFVIAFVLPLVGYLLIIALPDRGGSYMKALESDDLPEL